MRIHLPFRPLDYVVLVVYFVGMSLLALASLWFRIQSDELLNWYLLFFLSVTLICLLWYVFEQRNPVNKVDEQSDNQLVGLYPAPPPMPVTIVWLYILGGFVAAYAIQLLMALALTSFFEVQPENVTNANEIMQLVQQNILFAFVVVLCAPIIEEVIFRGIFFRRFAASGRFWGAWLVSSLLFAAGHLMLLAFLTFTMLGMLLAFLYHRTGRLWAAMVLHVMINSFTMLAQFVISQ